jgi:glycosyltransferase involved in cell wall biosynthesis
MDRVRILFLPGVDADNTNAQSLNVREITLRLDPKRFQSTLWYEREPDSRLWNRDGIRLLKLPTRGKTFRITKELLAGYDIIAYVDYSPASYLFVHLPRVMRRQTRAVFHAEGPNAQMENPSCLMGLLYRGVLPRCDVYTGITEFVARDISSSARSQVRFILPVGVDTNLFSVPEKRGGSVPTVLFAGTLIERKGPQLVIDAASIFRDTNFRLVGAGRRGFETVLQDKITQLGLSNVRLERPQSQAQILDTMRTSDILILPSRLEGIPKVALEAAATGLPCIVFRDYETPSVVDGVTGFQVATPDEMMQRLGQLISNRSLREEMGHAARRHVLQFDWDLVSKQWQNAYLDIASRPA